MSTIKLLVVEDDAQDLDTCRSTVERYQDERSVKVELVECKDFNEAFSRLDDTFDGAIIDLRLGDDGDEGNQVIQYIKERHYRIPVAILTGTPSAADPEFSYIGVFKKGEPGAGYYDLVDRFWKIYGTGLTRILGGRGIIESRLGEVFWNNILPQIVQWEVYGQVDSTTTENALLRHTLNHLIQLIDEDVTRYFPEEFYLHPPPGQNIRTGTILKDKKTGGQFVVMSPDCDLVIRSNGSRNTDRVLLVEVISPNVLFNWYGKEDPNILGRERKTKFIRTLNNNAERYVHCLPETNFFPLGFMNFRSVSTVEGPSISHRFNLPAQAQIAPPFVKDIVARFSSYYARQGQPDVDFTGLITSPDSESENM